MSRPDALEGEAHVEVHLLKLPVDIWARAQEHGDGLLREFALIAADPHGDHGVRAIPAQLGELVDALNEQYEGITTEKELALAEAANSGVAEIDDLVFQVPPEARQASVHLSAMLDEADDYCRSGQHLLTLATPPDLVVFRQWYLGQFISQIGGADPVAWPDYLGHT